jgi:hypothetical protein
MKFQKDMHSFSEKSSENISYCALTIGKKSPWGAYLLDIGRYF